MSMIVNFLRQLQLFSSPFLQFFTVIFTTAIKRKARNRVLRTQRFAEEIQKPKNDETSLMNCRYKLKIVSRNDGNWWCGALVIAYARNPEDPGSIPTSVENIIVISPTRIGSDLFSRLIFPANSHC
jgi:hypothetical protein